MDINQNHKDISVLYTQGYSIRDISQQYPFSTVKVRAIIRAMGIPIRQKSESMKLHYSIFPKSTLKLKTPIKQLWDEYQNGESLVTLGQKYNIDSSTIGEKFRRWGFPLRTHLESIYVSQAQGRKPYKRDKIKGPGGYVMVLQEGHPRANRDGYVREHILIWEKVHGRSVPKGHHIHHFNGVKDDNRPENLMAMSQKDHHSQPRPYQKRIKELEQEIARLKQLNMQF